MLAQQEFETDAPIITGGKGREGREAQKEELAHQEFEAAAMALMVETLKICRALRPKAKWGFCAYIPHMLIAINSYTAMQPVATPQALYVTHRLAFGL